MMPLLDLMAAIAVPSGKAMHEPDVVTAGGALEHVLLQLRVGEHAPVWLGQYFACEPQIAPTSKRTTIEQSLLPDSARIDLHQRTVS
jgi:hypothetical protein